MIMKERERASYTLPINASFALFNPLIPAGDINADMPTVVFDKEIHFLELTIIRSLIRIFNKA